MRLIIAGHGDVHVKAVGVSGLRQQLLGLFGVIAVVIGQGIIKIFAERGIHTGPQQCAVAVKGQIQNLLAVNGIAQCLPHPHIVKGRLGVVEIQRLHQIHGALLHMESLAKLRHLCGGQVGEQVHRAALEAHHHAVRILDNFVGHLAQTGLFAPVIVKALQHHRVLRGPGHKLERAGAYRRGVVLGKHSRGQIGDKLVAGLGEAEANGVLALLINFRVGKGRHLNNIRTVRISAALIGPDHVLRRHVLSVVELYAGAETDSIKQMVIGNGIALCQSRLEVAGAVGLQETLKYVEHDLTGPRLHGLVRVKAAVEVLGDADIQLARRGTGRYGVRSPVVVCLAAVSVAAAPASGEYGAQEAQSRQQCCNPLFHIQFSFFITARNESVCLPFQSRAAARRHC